MDPNQVKFAVFYIFICTSLYLITGTLYSTNYATEELTFYTEDLPPAENVLLATGYRTGSSFFAELFNQNDDVFYLFEPEHNLLKSDGSNWMRTEIQEKWASFVLDLFQCNFTNPALINPKSTGQIIFKHKSKILASHKFCDGEKCRHFNSSKAEAICRAKKRVIKTIKPARIDVLIKEAERRNVDLRILLYFRDARPVFLSRRKAHDLPASTYYLNIARYCSEKLKQYNFYADHTALHSRLKSLKFEELAYNPEIEARKIYNYLKWKIPANLHSWIGNNTRENSGGNYGTSRNSTAKISEWKQKIGEEDKFLIDTVCKDFLNTLNYNL